MRLRRHIAVAVAIVVSGGLVAWGTLGDRELRLVGSNSVAPVTGVVAFTPQRELCVRDAWLPGGTGAVVMALGTAGGPPTPVDLTVTGRAGRLRSQATIRATRERSVDFPLDGPQRGGPATLCLRPRRGQVVAAGVITEPFQGTNYAPTSRDLGLAPTTFLGGQPQTTLVAVRFKARRATSALGDLDRGARRAARFRPGWVGPWTFAGLAVLVAALWALGLATLWRVR
jgi:hypothetical protein